MRIPCWLHTTGNKRDWAPYPTPLTVGGATDRGGSGQKDKCALVSAANHLCLGDCRKPEKVIKGIYITFCTPPRVHTEMFNFILSHYGQRLHNMNNIISQIIWFDSNEDVPHQDGFMWDTNKGNSWKYTIKSNQIDLSSCVWHSLKLSFWFPILLTISYAVFVGAIGVNRRCSRLDIRDRWLRQALQGRTSSHGGLWRGSGKVLRMGRCVILARCNGTPRTRRPCQGTGFPGWGWLGWTWGFHAAFLQILNWPLDDLC